MKLILFVLIAFAFSASQAKAAPPTLGADCGPGSTVVGDRTGNKYAAGKITLGAVLPGPILSYKHTCTLTWPAWPQEPSCSASLEEDSLGSSGDPDDPSPGPYGTLSTTTTLRIDDWSGNIAEMRQGYVVSYLCIGR